MVREFAPVRPESSPRGLIVASRIADAWKGIGVAGGGAGGGFIHDFREDPTGTPSSDFTMMDSPTTFTVTEIDGTNALHVQASQSAVRWNIVDPAPKMEVLICGRGIWETHNVRGPAGCLQTANDNRVLGFTDGGVRAWNRRTGGTGFVGSSQGSGIPSDQWGYVRAQFDPDNDTLRMKGWLLEEQEPSSWFTWTIHSSHEPGHIGLTAYSATQEQYYRWISASDDYESYPAPFID